MATREIVGDGLKKTPQIRPVAGQRFVGKYLGARAIEKLKGKILYEFAVMEGTTANLQITVAPREYAEAEVEIGDTVGIFEQAQLKQKLAKVNVGEVVEMDYLGKKSAASGNTYHDWKIGVRE